jgi:hypothetical protein
MFGLTKDQFLGIFRHLITFAGGVLVARGRLEPAAVESIVGALVTIVGVFFSMLSPEKNLPVPDAPPTATGTVPNPGAKIVIPPGA